MLFFLDTLIVCSIALTKARADEIEREFQTSIAEIIAELEKIQVCMHTEYVFLQRLICASVLIIARRFPYWCMYNSLFLLADAQRHMFLLL